MAYTKTKMVEPSEGWFDFGFNLSKVLAPYVAAVTIMWRIIDRVAKFFADGREAQLKLIVENQTKEIKESLTELKEAVMELKFNQKAR